MFAYPERYGISREDALTPREDREDFGGDKQQLVLAFFDTEDAADQAAKALKDWEKATESCRGRRARLGFRGRGGDAEAYGAGRYPGDPRGGQGGG